MKISDIIGMQMDYFIFKMYKRSVEKSDKKIKKLREELEIEEAYNEVISKRTLKHCRYYRKRYETVFNKGGN